MADSRKLFKVVAAVRRGGIRAVEITMTTPGAIDLVRTLAAEKPEGALLGAGTVLDAQGADAVIKAGADFVVSPVMNLDVVRACRANDRFVAPGAFSPTEILSAWENGADVVKNIRRPLPHIRLMPTGGVSAENAKDFIEAGACCIAIGTALLDPKTIEREDWDALARKARELVDSLEG
jgi:2-dehydro-3-deoxyphosphogluconate aldolase/(4S)-4-hydroxy-2-oxoglutarate aldolase